jgi:hypothetical protein
VPPKRKKKKKEETQASMLVLSRDAFQQQEAFTRGWPHAFGFPSSQNHEVEKPFFFIITRPMAFSDSTRKMD